MPEWIGEIPGIRYGGKGWWALAWDLVEAVRPQQFQPKRRLWTDEFKRKLRPYQARIIPWALERRGVLIADKMRLGKTIEALSIAFNEFNTAITHAHRPAVAVVQAAKLWDWAEESVGLIDGWGERVEILQAPSKRRKGDRVTEGAWLYVVNYEILDRWLPFLASLNPLAVILDECVYVKGRSSKRHKVAVELCDSVRDSGGLTIGLSGEPVEDRRFDLWGQWRCIRGEDESDSFWKFHKRYCDGRMIRQADVDEDFDPETDGDGWMGYDRTGISHTDELKLRMRSWMVQRTKSDPEVMACLPKVAWKRVSIEGAKNAIPSAVATVCSDVVADGGKILVFCYYKQTVQQCIDSVLRALKDRGYESVEVVRMTGDDSAAARNRMLVESRKTSGPMVVVATIDAMGMGVNFSHFDDLTIAEAHYVPAKMMQAAERLWDVERIKPYSIHFITVRGSEDERVADLVCDKMSQIDETFGRTTESEGLQNVLGTPTVGRAEVMSELMAELRRIEDEG